MRSLSPSIFWLLLSQPVIISASAAEPSESPFHATRDGTRQQQQHQEMASTALDFREMLRKERELVTKKLATASLDSATGVRYLSRRRTRLDLKRNHRVAPPEGRKGFDGIYYVPSFVTKEEGRRLEDAARRGGEGAGGSGGPEWKELQKRRLQIHGGTPHPSGMVEEELPPFLQEVCDALVEVGVFPEGSPPNHVLLNEYSFGQGIGPHKDGPLYDGRVAILSLGKEACLHFWGSLEDAKADCAAVAAAAAAASADSTADSARSSSAAGVGAAAPSGGPGSMSSLEGTAEGGNGSAETGGHGRRGPAAAGRALASVRCEDCSLVVFEGQAYHDAWHGIASTASTSNSIPTTGAPPIAAVEAAAAAAAAAPPKDAQVMAGGAMAAGAAASDIGSSTSGEYAPASASGAETSTSASTASIAAKQGGEAAQQQRLSFTIRRVARVLPAGSLIEHAEARSEMDRRRRGFERSVTEINVDGDGPVSAAGAAVPAKAWREE